jgi:carboxylate-amine ligase
MGVEEEYLLVGPQSRAPAPAGPRVASVAAATLGDLVCGEFTQYQIEVKTPLCADAAVRGRRGAAGAVAAAARRGRRGSGVPRAAHLRLGHAGRRRMRACGDRGPPALSRRRQAVPRDARRFAICALHVHIHLPDPEVAVLAGNQLGPWLPLLVALSANSPFHRGRDTGCAD